MIESRIVIYYLKTIISSVGRKKDGFFTKKTVVCEKCGKQFEVRGNQTDTLCFQCFMNDQQLRFTMPGYEEYELQRKMMNGQMGDVFKNIFKSDSSYTWQKIEEIEKHRASILEKYRNSQAITRSMLQEAAVNYRRLQGPEIYDVVTRFLASILTGPKGIIYNKNKEFIVLTTFDGVVIDIKDIFAVGFYYDAKMNQKSNVNTIVCAVFTNDPYIPVFPVIHEVPMGSGGEMDIVNFYNELCPSLTYPVVEINVLKKIIEPEQKVKGNINKEEMEKFFAATASGIGVFDISEHSYYVPNYTTEYLGQYGYIPKDDAEISIGMEDKRTRDFWCFHINNIAGGGNGEK